MAFDGKPQDYAPAEVDEVGAIILKARELLSDPAKWTKYGDGVRRVGAVCINDACCDVERSMRAGGSLAFRAVQRIASFLTDGEDDNPTVVFQFNDRASTTHADVLALLDQAAKAGS